MCLQTDEQTDGRTTYDSNTALALRASRGKNSLVISLHQMSRRLSATTAWYALLVAQAYRTCTTQSYNMCCVHLFVVMAVVRKFVQHTEQ